MPDARPRAARRSAHGEPTAHVDTFARDHLPPRELWPVMEPGRIPELDYPARLNCAVELLDRAVAAGHGARIALRFADGQWSYADLLERANRIANVLTRDVGLVPGARVLLRGPNNAMIAACWFAVLKAGGICVTTMPLLRARELRYVIEKARVSLALVDARTMQEMDLACAQITEPPRIVAYGAEGAVAGSLDERMRAASTAYDAVDTAADDVALIAFTSGTTGKAKGTMHVHRDVLAICDCFPRHVLRADPGDIFCGSPPFAFTFGLGGLLLFPLRIGASTLLLEQAAPPKLAEAIARHRATVCFTAPTAYRAMAPLAKVHDLSSLRLCVSAGETLPLGIFQAWEEATGVRIIDGIGTTELLHIFISASGADIRPGSTGKVVPGYEARVVDDRGEPVPAGEIGRLAVRGPTGCRYLDDVERQRAYVQNGWNMTGDSYRLDADGYFWYEARSDDMIVSAGYNISGPEVENVLLEHPAVQECGVVAAPDPERGHVVKAFIVLRPPVTPDEALVKTLQDFVKSVIAPYKYPRAIEFVDALPRTETGKLQRFRLRGPA